jgi:hypothetical protein
MRPMMMPLSILDEGGSSYDELVKLPTETLERISADLAYEEEVLKKRKARLYQALHDRFAVDLKPGTHWTDSQGRKVRIEVPKQVEWDQEELKRVAEYIKVEMRENPREFIDYKLFVPENRYKAWPTVIQAMFEPARTVSPGKPKITFVEPK